MAAVCAHYLGVWLFLWITWIFVSASRGDFDPSHLPPPEKVWIGAALIASVIVAAVCLMSFPEVLGGNLKICES